MLNLVEVRTATGNLLGLPLEDISDGLVLAEIQGLDPVKATIVSSSFAQQDGSQYHSSRREDRNIKLKIDLEPDYVTTTVRDLRNRIYNYFMPKSQVDLRFYDSDGLVLDISGIVESCENDMFSKDQTMDISVICNDPDLVDLTPVVVSGDTVSDTTESTITYDGTVESGFDFVLNVNRSITQFTIYFQPPDGTLRTMDVTVAMVAGDVLKIGTVSGNKYATLTRAGTTTSVLYGISPQSNYHEFMKGDNKIRVYATGAAIPYTITYNVRYGAL